MPFKDGLWEVKQYYIKVLDFIDYFAEFPKLDVVNIIFTMLKPT